MAEGGICRVSHEQLVAAGVDLSGTPAGVLTLTVGGALVPLHAGGAGTFGPGSFVEFVAEASTSLYTAVNVYRLLAGGTPPLRPALDRTRPRARGAATSALATVTLGARREYAFESPTADPWYDTRMLAKQAPAEWTFAFDAAGLAAPAAGAAISLALFGGTTFEADPDHHVEAAVNGVTLADLHFDGLAEHRATLPLPAGLLRERDNRLVLRLPADLGTPFDVVHLQEYAVSYPRALRADGGRATFTGGAAAYSVAGFSRPEIVAYRSRGGAVERLARLRVRRDRAGGFTATVPGAPGEAVYHVADESSLVAARVAPPRDAAGLRHGRAQYLVIAHRDFLAGLAPLVATREAQGLAVKLADVDDVYAEFGHGAVDPEAIRGYVAHAYASMGTELVLLVGGDTYDYRGYLDTPSRSFVPSLYTATSEIVRFAPVDPALADVDRDGVPDLAIGRLPVRTAAELDAVVAKTLAYERKTYARTAILVADRTDARIGTSYRVSSELIAAALGGDWTIRRLYLDEIVPVNLRPWLLEAIGHGAAITSYVGHSAPASWAREAILSTQDVPALANAERPTVVLQWGGGNPPPAPPRAAGRGAARRRAAGGAAAALGATALSDDASQEALARLLAAELARPGARLGAALLAAKRALAAASPGLVDVQLGWTLLGDPALAVTP